jgi:hypothetical protein
VQNGTPDREQLGSTGQDSDNGGGAQFPSSQLPPSGSSQLPGATPDKARSLTPEDQQADVVEWVQVVALDVVAVQVVEEAGQPANHDLQAQKCPVSNCEVAVVGAEPLRRQPVQRACLA